MGLCLFHIFLFFWFSDSHVEIATITSRSGHAASRFCGKSEDHLWNGWGQAGPLWKKTKKTSSNHCFLLESWTASCEAHHYAAVRPPWPSPLSCAESHRESNRRNKEAHWPEGGNSLEWWLRPAVQSKNISLFFQFVSYILKLSEYIWGDSKGKDGERPSLKKVEPRYLRPYARRRALSRDAFRRAVRDATCHWASATWREKRIYFYSVQSKLRSLFQDYKLKVLPYLFSEQVQFCSAVTVQGSNSEELLWSRPLKGAVFFICLFVPYCHTKSFESLYWVDNDYLHGFFAQHE